MTISVQLHSVWERVYLLPKKQSAQRIERSLFLAALVKYFDIPDNVKVQLFARLYLWNSPHRPQIDLRMQVYLAEVLAYLPYRIIEDPLSVVYHINKLLAMRGENVLSLVKVAPKRRATILRHLQEQKESKEVSPALAAQCTNMALLIVLKNFLKVLYCLSESKCRAYMPSAVASGEATNKERKDKQLVPRSEVLERPSPFSSVIVGDVRPPFTHLVADFYRSSHSKWRSSRR